MRLTPFWVGLLILLSVRAAVGQNLCLATSHGYPRSSNGDNGFQDLILKEACRRIGLSLSIDHVPSERAAVNANEGIVDGVYARTAGMEEKYPDLIMVPEKFTELVFSAFTVNPEITIQDWRSLCRYEVGVIAGWKIVEEQLESCPNVIKVKDADALFAMLEQGRVDLVVYDGLQTQGIWPKGRTNRVRIFERALAKADMFVYLHKSKADLVPKLSQALADMKRDGTFQAIMGQVMQRVRP